MGGIWELVDDDVTTGDELADAVVALSLSEDDRVFVDYAAPWCSKCKKFKGRLKEMGVNVLEVDVSECEDLALDKGVSSVPYFEVFTGTGKLLLSGNDFEASAALFPAALSKSKPVSKPEPASAPVPAPAQQTSTSESPQPWSRASDILQGNAASDLEVAMERLLALKRSEEQRPLNVAYYPGGIRCADAQTDGAVDAVVLAQQLQKSILKLYSSFLSEDGNSVDYRGISQSPLFREYVDMTRKLSSVDLGALPEVERKAFFLNLYNALCIHGTVIYGPARLGHLKDFFGNYKISYEIGGYKFNLDDMEHGIIRNNKNGKQFPDPSDPRLAHTIPLDPRIHFALVCGAKSCPPIRIFSADNLDRGLDLAAETFLRGEVDVSKGDDGKLSISASKLLMWYGDDMGPSLEHVLRWVAKYLTETDAQAITSALDEGGVDAVRVTYKDYNWTSNAASH